MPAKETELKNFKWKYVWPYLVFGTTITVLVIANTRLIQNAVRQNDTFVSVINLAGKQRLLSQKALTNTLFFSKEGNYPPLFEKEVEQWNRTHYDLQNHDIYGSRSYLSNKTILASFKKLNPIQQSLYLELLKKKADDLAINKVKELQSEYLPLMDEIVTLLQQESERRLLEIRNNQVLLVVFSGLILILEILILIVPYHRRLINAYRDLKVQKQVIEDQKEEIEQHVDTLASQNAQLENLHRSEELTLAGINAGVWNWNMETGSEVWSHNFYKLLGYDVEELPATFDVFLNVLLHPDDVTPVLEAVDAHLKEGVAYKMNIRMKIKTGSYKWFETSGMAARNFDGKPIQMAGSIIDIDDKINYRNRLEISNQAKDKIFAILSHDLRSPLTGIKGLLELQSETGLAHAEFEEYLQVMRDNVGFALKTLDNVLIWASSQMKIVKVSASNFRIGDIFADVEQFHRYLAKQKKISIAYSSAPSVWGYADPNHIFIITRNLVGNAIKFTSEEGKIDVEAKINENKLQVTVNDSGVGMEQDVIDRLLNSNEHVSTYGTNGEKGTGLGINLILELLQLNNGKLSIQSQIGKGSSFTYFIPLGVEEQAI